MSGNWCSALTSLVSGSATTGVGKRITRRLVDSLVLTVSSNRSVRLSLTIAFGQARRPRARDAITASYRTMLWDEQSRSSSKDACRQYAVGHHGDAAGAREGRALPIRTPDKLAADVRSVVINDYRTNVLVRHAHSATRRCVDASMSQPLAIV